MSNLQRYSNSISILKRLFSSHLFIILSLQCIFFTSFIPKSLSTLPSGRDIILKRYKIHSSVLSNGKRVYVKLKLDPSLKRRRDRYREGGNHITTKKISRNRVIHKATKSKQITASINRQVQAVNVKSSTKVPGTKTTIVKKKASKPPTGTDPFPTPSVVIVTDPKPNQKSTKNGKAVVSSSKKSSKKKNGNRNLTLEWKRPNDTYLYRQLNVNYTPFGKVVVKSRKIKVTNRKIPK